MLYILISIFLSLDPNIGNVQVEDWEVADERAGAAHREKNWNLAIEEARRAVRLYEKKTDTFDADLYVSLVEQLSDFYSCEGDGRAAVFALANGIRELIDRYGYRKPELLQLYKEQARYYDLMFDFKKVDWRLQSRIDLSARLFEEGSEERLAVVLERISWLIGKRRASPKTLESLLESARTEIRLDSLSQRAWLMDYEARIAEYAGETERAEEISQNLLGFVGRLSSGSILLSGVYSRLGRLYLHSGRQAAFLDILSQAAAAPTPYIKDAAIIHSLPKFSADAEARGLLAKFTFRVDVDAEGRVVDLSLVESNANDALEQEFLQAVRNDWRFLPGLDTDGRRIPRTIASTDFAFAAPNNARRYLR